MRQVKDTCLDEQFGNSTYIELTNHTSFFSFCKKGTYRKVVTKRGKSEIKWACAKNPEKKYTRTYSENKIRINNWQV